MAIPWTEEQHALVSALLRGGTGVNATARETGLRRETIRMVARRLAEEGDLGTKPVLPGFAIRKITTQLDGQGNLKGESIQQAKAPGEVFEKPETHTLAKITVQRDPEGRVIQSWDRFEPNRLLQEAAQKAAFEALLEELPRVEPVKAPAIAISSMLSQYTITDMHLGALAWNVETGSGDYDLAIGEKLLIDWFGAAIAASPASKHAVFAQLGDFLHYDSFKAWTPESNHLLDADGRYPLLVRTAIRCMRQIIRMLLAKHGEVTVIMSDANHDSSSQVCFREMFAAFYEDEPRLTIDTNPGTYSAVEHGDVSLFYHHGHRRGVKDVDAVFAGKYRSIYGRTRFSYAHLGHLHSDELKTTNLMKVERHETLAAPDAYAANGGYLSGRSAKVIHYHAKRGEVSRTVITPEMVLDWAA